MAEKKDPPIEPKKQQWSILRFVDKTHPSFLDAFKQTQPLSELAALSIIIAAFATDQPGARQFATVAGAMFLLAFILSTAVVLGAKGMMIELVSFVVTGFGIIFLGGVVIEYAVASQLLGNTLGIAGDYVNGLIQIAIAPAFIRDLAKGLREKKRSRNWYILVGSSLVMIGLLTYNAINWLVYIPYKQLSTGTTPSSDFSYSLLVVVLGLVIGRVLIALFRRQKVLKIQVTG